MTRATLVPRRRIIITVCPKERGTAVLSVKPGTPRRRLDAGAILRELQALVGRRNLDAVVRVREGCAGGCHGRGPNVSLTLHVLPAPGERPDNIAIGWRTYVGSLAEMPSLQAILDENLR
jgi:hypothetical protein